MAQAKYFQYNSADDSKTSLNSMGFHHRPMPRLSMPEVTVPKIAELLPDSRAVKTIVIPRKTSSEEDVLKTTFVSQMKDGRLIYCFEDGQIDLYTPSTDGVVIKNLSVLPQGTVTSVYELPDQRLLIGRKDKTLYLVDFQRESALKMDFPFVEVKSVLALDQNSAFIGTEDGQLIHWHLDDNRSLDNWPVDKEAPILSLAETTNRNLLLISHNEKGFSIWLFDTNNNEFELKQCIDFDDFHLIGETIVRISYDPQTDPDNPLSLITQSEIQPSCLNLHRIKGDETDSHLLSSKNKSYRDRAAFVLPSGNLAFSCYRDAEQNAAVTETNNGRCPPDFVLEIQEFSFSDALQMQSSVKNDQLKF